MLERIVRLPEVKSVSGLSRSSIYAHVRLGLLPRPILISRRAIGWKESELAAVNAARVRGATDEEIRSLVVELERARKSAA